MNKFSELAITVLCGGIALFAADAMAGKDQSFVTKASQGGAAEVKLGHLAAEKGSNQKVKDFGKKMEEDHSKAGNELSSIAQKKSLQTSSELTSKDNALLNRLNGLSGEAFDKAYMSAMVKDHEQDIAEFEKEANSGSDPDVKAFASKTLPTLKDHLQMAKDAATAVSASMK